MVNSFLFLEKNKEKDARRSERVKIQRERVKRESRKKRVWEIEDEIATTCFQHVSQ